MACSYCGNEGHNIRSCIKRRETIRKREGSKTKPEATLLEKITSWEVAEAVIPNSRIILLYGPPGTGKTTAGNFAGNPEPPVFNITLTEETPAAELRGHYVPRGGDFVWQDGPALAAFRQGKRLVLNEIDKASGDALQFCNALLDDVSVSAITLPTGETVVPAESFSVVATMNGVPEDLPDALRDRFSIRVLIDMPHSEAVKSLPEDIRKPALNGFKEKSGFTFRNWKAFAHLREMVGPEIAALAVFGDRAETVINTLKIGGKAGFKSYDPYLAADNPLGLVPGDKYLVGGNPATFTFVSYGNICPDLGPDFGGYGKHSPEADYGEDYVWGTRDSDGMLLGFFPSRITETWNEDF